jgi:calcineurin-like phosphoesterase family protein
VNRIFFVADTHFGDEAILHYENRPFKTVDEMDSSIIKDWNKTVDDSDTVFVIGDFGGVGREKKILNKLNGKKILIKGNHDLKSNQEYRLDGFAEVYDFPVIFEEFWILSHAPIYVNTNMPYANIFGHVHNNPIFKDYSNQHFCVSIERLNYKPISFDEIKRKVKENVNNV